MLTFGFVLKKSDSDIISGFYNEVHFDYLNWSRLLNIHFGYISWKTPLHFFSSEKMLDEMNAQVAKRLNLPDDSPFFVLDAGCGVGSTCRKMASEKPNCKFYGVNISAVQIGYGLAKNREAGLAGQVELEVADYLSIPQKADCFESAFAIESACYSPGSSKAEFIHEMARVLKPGGRIVVADGFVKHSKPLPKWLKRLHQRNLKFWAMTELADIELFTKELESNGFDVEKVEDISWNVAPSAFYLPFTAFKVLLKRLFLNKNQLSTHQRNYPKAIWLTLFLGMFRQYFGYFLVTARLNHQPSTSEMKLG